MIRLVGALMVCCMLASCASSQKDGPAPKDRPHFVMPLDGRITSTFGNRLSPSTQKLRAHTGLDISQKRDTPVRSAATGYVRSIGMQRGYGKTIVLDHGNGWETLYAHLSGYAVRVGQQVSRDDIIGTVGATGNATGPHLHFEIRRGGVPLDPAQFIGFSGS